MLRKHLDIFPEAQILSLLKMVLKVQGCHPPNGLSCPAHEVQAEFNNEVQKVNRHLWDVS